MKALLITWRRIAAFIRTNDIISAPRHESVYDIVRVPLLISTH